MDIRSGESDFATPRAAVDPKKNRRNVTIHGIAFEDAVRVFDGPTLVRRIRDSGYPRG